MIFLFKNKQTNIPYDIQIFVLSTSHIYPWEKWIQMHANINIINNTQWMKRLSFKIYQVQQKQEQNKKHKCSGNSHSKRNNKNTTFCCWHDPENGPGPWKVSTGTAHLGLSPYTVWTFLHFTALHSATVSPVLEIHTAVTQSAIHVFLQYILQSPKVLYKCPRNTAVN